VEHSDIAISSLAFHRSGLIEGCPLKTRDYLAWGLPTILGYKDSIFYDNQKPEWILEVDFKNQSFESQINLIVNFSISMQYHIVSRESVIPLVDSAVIEQHRLDFISSKLLPTQN
jgi:hypothetical protein